MAELPNVRQLSNGCYLVRTQAGFKRAIKAYFNEYQLSRPRDIVGYPKVYPSVVRLRFLHGWNEAQAHCTPLDEYRTSLDDLLTDLSGE